MIYEMIDNCLNGLVSQWQDLAAAFHRFSDEFQDDEDMRDGLYGLGNACSLEADRIEAERETIPGLGAAPAVIGAAISLFSESDTARQVIWRGFALQPTLEEPDWLGFGEEDEANDPSTERQCRNQLHQLSRFIAECMQEFQEIDTDEGQRFHIAGIRGGIDNITSYPVLTSGGGHDGPYPATSGSNGSSLDAMLDRTLRNVMGRVPRNHDPRAFLAALGHSFQRVEVAGQTQIRWTQRGYAGVTELGGRVSGAQASLYNRATVIRDNALPLLDGLEPLIPDPDIELVDASRAIVRTQLVELINELGVEGGPRAARVERIFESLLQQSITDDRTRTQVEEGYLGYLQHVYGLLPGQINTLTEEAMYTDYRMLRDYIESLHQSWQGFYAEWNNRDLGTRLVHLERALSVVAETVHEVEAAMNSVFVGEAERQVASFRDEQGRDIRISELLSWVTSFTVEEAPRLIDDGGRNGIQAIIPTAMALSHFVDLFIRAIPYGDNLPEGLHHPRVVRPLQELRDYLQQVLRLAQDVYRP